MIRIQISEAVRAYATTNKIMQTNTNTEIRFTLGEETKPIIEQFGEGAPPFKSSIFYEQYKQALSRIADFVSLTDSESSLSADLYLGGYCSNNIFTFIGERGSGKTSCMLTLNRLLVHPDVEELFPYNKQLKKIKDTTFCDCDIINPAFFDQEQNILKIFIGVLYKKFKAQEESKKKVH